MFCRICGNRLPEDAVFCSVCGRRVVNAPGEAQQSEQGGVAPSMNSGPMTPPMGYSPTVPAQPGLFTIPPTVSAQPPMPQPQAGPFTAPSMPAQAPVSQPGLYTVPLVPAQPLEQQSGPFTIPPTMAAQPPAPQPGPFILPTVAVPPPAPNSSPYFPPMVAGQPPAPNSSPYFPPVIAGQPPTQHGPSPFTPSSPSYPSLWPATPAPPAPPAAPLPPPPPPPLNAMQRRLVRTFQPAMASNALFGVLLGSIVALVGGVVVTWLLLLAAHAIAPHAGMYFLNNGDDAFLYSLGISPLHSGWRDSLQLFLIMHGVSVHTLYQDTAQNYTSNFTGIAALTGLLIVPAVLLTLGGYIAACTDMLNRPQSSLLRGAAIALPYMILLLLLVTQVNGPIPQQQGNGSSPSLTVTNTLNMDITSLIIFGLLWGALFGTLGASLKLARGRWRYFIRQVLLRTRHPQIAGMLVGGLTAVGVGLGLALLFVCGFLAYSSLSTGVLSSRLCYPGSWQYLLSWGITQGPLHAVNLYLFSFGSPITVTNIGLNGTTCFYTNAAHMTVTLRDSSLHLPGWVYATLLLPAISLFLGGRASVAASRVQGSGPAALQGALIAVPFTVLMLLLSLISTITYSSTYTTSSTSSSPVSNTLSSMGAGASDLILWALLSGAVLGMLGGIYEVSYFKTDVRSLFAAIGKVLSIPARPVYWLFDRWSRQPSSSRTRARTLFYGAFAMALLLAIVALIVGVNLIAMDQSISLADNLRIRDIVSTLLIVLPGLLVLSACVSALATDPGAPKN